MQIPKQFFEDRLALSLSIASVLAAFLTIILLLVRLNLGSAGSSSFIIGYRQNLGIEAFQSGGLAGVLCFIGFAIVVLVLQVVLAWRTYLVERRVAIGVLTSGLFLLLLCLVVSNALLALH